MEMFTKLQYINPYLEMLASHVPSGKNACVCVHAFVFEYVYMPTFLFAAHSNKEYVCNLGNFLL